MEECPSSTGDPFLYLSNPPGIDSQAQRASLDAIQQLNELSMIASVTPSLWPGFKVTRWHTSYKRVHRVDGSGQESAETLAMYGIKNPKEANFARNCLLARRLIERGVRFVQLFHEAWDQHGNLKEVFNRSVGYRSS